MKDLSPEAGLITRYREYLPITSRTPNISLGEGSTPLIFLHQLSELIGFKVYAKYEGLNPTGSFKDRGMTVAVSKACEEKVHAVLCASTGNTSAAAAAYAARARIKCVVILPAGKIARGKMVQAHIYGASIIGIKAGFDRALELVRELEKTGDYSIVNSINTFRIEGQKTASFEIIEELGFAPDVHILPVGNAGNISAYWQGYSEFYKSGRIDSLPKMVGVQAAGAAPFYIGKMIENPDTIATAIRIGYPASWDKAQESVRLSGGIFDIVQDTEILYAQKWLASHEGIFAEPASATPIAYLLKYFSKNSSPINEKTKEIFVSSTKKQITCVVTITGHGLKDPDTVMNSNLENKIEVEGTLEAVKKILSS